MSTNKRITAFIIALALVTGLAPVGVYADSATAPTITSVSGAELTYGYAAGSGTVNVAAAPADGHTITGYQWYENTVNSNVSGTAIVGATASTYAISAGKNAGTYYYYCEVTATKTSDSTTAAAVSSVAAVNVAPKAVTVSGIIANDKVYDHYDDAELDVSGVSFEGILPGDAGNLTVTGTAVFEDKNVGTGKNVIITGPGLTLGGTAAGNYVLTATTASLTADISILYITIDGIDASDKIYDGTVTATIDQEAVSGDPTDPYDGDAIVFSGVGEFDSADVGEDKPVTFTGITISGADAGNYALNNTTATGTGVITYRAITVTASDQNVVINGVIDTSTASAVLTGAVTGHALGAVTLTSSATDALTTSGIITPSAATIMSGAADVSANYSISYVNGTLTVGKAAPVYTAPAAVDPIYNGSAQALVTAGSTSDGAIVFSDEPAGVYTAAVPVATDAGIYTVWWKLNGDATHSDVAAASIAAVVQQKSVTVSAFDVVTKEYDKTTAASVSAASVIFDGILPGDTLTVSGIAYYETAGAGGEKTVYYTGLVLGGPSVGNYVLTTTTAIDEGDINPKAATVTAIDASKIYGDADPLLTASEEGIIAGDVINYVLTTGGVTAAGVYPISVDIVYTGDGFNYAFATAGAVFTISPKALYVTADAINKAVGTSDPALTYSYSALGGGDTPAAVFTGSLSRAAGEAIGVYAITKGSLIANANYNMFFTGSNLTITAAPAPVTGGDDSSDNGRRSYGPYLSGVSDKLTTDVHIAYAGGYENGYFMPESKITRGEVAMIFYRLLKIKGVTVTVSFPDVKKGEWYETAVNVLASLGIINGDTEGNFRPEDYITRAEFIAIASRFAKKAETTISFKDVKPDYWAYSEIETAVAYGWINGYPDGTFAPEQPVTRAEVIAVVNRMLGRRGDKDYILKYQDSIVQFPDNQKQDEWYYLDIIEASNTHEYTITNDTEKWK